ncbi:PREDICTED: glutathione S-transferase omega-1-like [Amphimedon queenslandica]|uniref:Glutathione S-transferase omega n=1 Tax=Amphimedon queenslandica TaxID=400682 RepID=A0A1X7VRS3_AMPQE|nr:PREDICTED: glutathione S-transferase omega-1-like [Amphimedon queenslandica]|eukprot:XP_003382979.1 PREDICTED: glutathione S-transferase omega-1-like [Amphimedon queenslandica]
MSLIRTRPEEKGADIPLRIYSNPICPYAQRARLIAAFKGVKHEIINVHLKEKPQWYLDDINPYGLVPTIEHNGHLIRESLVTFEYIDEVFGDSHSWPTDPYKKAQAKLLLSDFGDRFTPNYYKYYRNAQDENTPKLLQKYFKSVEELIAQNGGPFIFGKNVSAIDLLIWPWFERLPALFTHAPELKTLYSVDSVPLLIKWDAAMRETDAVKSTITPAERMTAFLANALSNGGKHDYSLLNIDGLKIYTKETE